MKNIRQSSSKVKHVYVIGVVLLIGAIIGFVYFSSNPEKITAGIQKTDCDNRFLEWCKAHPEGGVDYDNFAVENRDCTDRGSYRTCQQVSEALS